MRDPFAKARAQAASRSAGPSVSIPGAQGSSPAPQAPQAPGVGQTMQKPPDFKSLKKKLGLSSLKLDKDPIAARTQLMQHLAEKLGPGFMSHPGVHTLLESFNDHVTSPEQQEVHGAQAGRISDLMS